MHLSAYTRGICDKHKRGPVRQHVTDYENKPAGTRPSFAWILGCHGSTQATGSTTYVACQSVHSGLSLPKRQAIRMETYTQLPTPICQDNKSATKTRRQVTHQPTNAKSMSLPSSAATEYPLAITRHQSEERSGKIYNRNEQGQGILK